MPPLPLPLPLPEDAVSPPENSEIKPNSGLWHKLSPDVTGNIGHAKTACKHRVHQLQRRRGDGRR